MRRKNNTSGTARETLDGLQQIGGRATRLAGFDVGRQPNDWKPEGHEYITLPIGVKDMDDCLFLKLESGEVCVAYADWRAKASKGELVVLFSAGRVTVGIFDTDETHRLITHLGKTIGKVKHAHLKHGRSVSIYHIADVWRDGERITYECVGIHPSHQREHNENLPKDTLIIGDAFWPEDEATGGLIFLAEHRRTKPTVSDTLDITDIPPTEGAENWPYDLTFSTTEDGKFINVVYETDDVREGDRAFIEDEQSKRCHIGHFSGDLCYVRLTNGPELVAEIHRSRANIIGRVVDVWTNSGSNNVRVTDEYEGVRPIVEKAIVYQFRKGA